MGNAFSACSNTSVVRPDDHIPNKLIPDSKSKSTSDLKILLRSVAIEQEQWHFSNPSMTFTLDSSNLIIGDSDGYISNFSTYHKVTPTKFRPPRCKGISALKISFDGSFLLIGTSDGSVIMLDIAEGFQTVTARLLIEENVPIMDLCLSQDQLLLGAITESGLVSLIFIKQMRTVYQKKFSGMNPGRTKISFNQDATSIFVSNTTLPLLEIELPSFREKRVWLPNFEYWIHFPPYAPIEFVLAVGKAEAFLVHATTSECLKPFASPPLLEAETVVFSPEARLIGSTANKTMTHTSIDPYQNSLLFRLDTNIKGLQSSLHSEYFAVVQETKKGLLPLLYERKTCKLSHLNKISMKFKLSICFTYNSKYLIAVNDRDFFVKIDTRTGLVEEEMGKLNEYTIRLIAAEKPTKEYPKSLRFFAKNQHHFLTIFLEGKSTWTEFKLAYQQPSTKEIHLGAGLFMKLATKNQSKAALYDLRKKHPACFHLRNVQGFKVDVKTKWAALLTEQEIHIVNLRKKKLIKIIKRPDPAFEIEAFVVKKKRIFVVGSIPSKKTYVDRKICVCDIIRGKTTILLLAVSHDSVGDNLSILSCLSALDGALLVYAFDNSKGTIIFLNANRLKVVRTLEMGSEIVNLIISPDSKQLAVLLKDGTIQFIDFIDEDMSDKRNLKMLS